MVNLHNLFLRIGELHFNAKKVSEDTGISTGNISDWKAGRSMPSASKLDILADYLNCSVDYLLGRATSDENNLLSEYRKLSSSEKAKVMQYINELSLNDISAASESLVFPDFTKHSNTTTAQVAAFGGDGVKTVHTTDEDALDDIK